MTAILAERRPPASPSVTNIRDLAIIGDRRTSALLGRDGTIVWYCPERFDRPSLMAGLLDPNGGTWRIETWGGEPAGRTYVEQSGVLETTLRVDGSLWSVTDWMPVGRDAPSGMICRLFSAAPSEVRIALRPKPDYARATCKIVSGDEVVSLGNVSFLYSSHPMEVERDTISITLSAGEAGWAVLSDSRLTNTPKIADILRWLDGTLAHWRDLASHDSYEGPYAAEVAASLRAIRLLTHDATGGIVAAATTSLPETLGGPKNWDYRFAWLRDAGMIVSALIRLGDELVTARRYLDFICRSRGSSSKYPMAITVTLDGEKAPHEEELDLVGFGGSRPVNIGNRAGDQLQLDGFASVLLAAKLLYRSIEERPHWDTIVEIAEFLTEHWREPDHGIWEETSKAQYTSNKVVVACALASAAEMSKDASQAGRWKSVADEIRVFVSQHCMTDEGAFAAVAGGHAVDVSAALFPAWGYVEAASPEMVATMTALDRDHSWERRLFWRHLEVDDARKEGAFLAGSFWVAQYWILMGDLQRARTIIDAALNYANDLGLFAEEAEPRGGTGGVMLGNIPQSFTHAAFIGAVVDLRHALAPLTR